MEGVINKIICLFIGHEWKGKNYLEYEHDHGSASSPLKMKYKCKRCQKKRV